MSVSAGVRALEEGRAFAHLAGWLTVTISGSDAIGWLNDLVTNRVDDIGPNELRRTLFLDRTGRVRADFHVETTQDRDGAPAGFLAYQDPAQPFRIDELLSPYLLSSEVDLRAEPDAIGVAVINSDISQVQFMAWPGPRDRIGWFPAIPDDPESGLQAARQYDEMTEATAEDAEVYRIRRGVPRFGVDFGEDWLPAEVGFEDLIDTGKGCFLGQESVAKVRNLGHPPRLVLPFQTGERVYPMAQVTADGEPVGRITSVAPLDDGGTAAVGWIKWDARDAELSVDTGASLAVRDAV